MMPDLAETPPKATKLSCQAKPMALTTGSNPQPSTEPSSLSISTTNLPMTTPLKMPAQGECLALTFDRTRPRELPCFFSDLDRLFKIRYKLSEDENKEYVVYYTDFKTEQTWKSLKEYSDATKTYLDFKTEILSHYPDATGEYVYSIRDMDMLISK